MDALTFVVTALAILGIAATIRELPLDGLRARRVDATLRQRLLDRDDVGDASARASAPPERVGACTPRARPSTRMTQ